MSQKERKKMAEKKMTQVEALEIAVAGMEDCEARDILAGMIETRRKANANRKPRVNKAALEFAETVYGVLDDEPKTNGEIAAVLSGDAEKGEDGYVSFQKVAAAIRKLKAADRVVEIAGEKAKDKKTYVRA